MESIDKSNYRQSVTKRLPPNPDVPLEEKFTHFIHEMKIGEEFNINDPELVSAKNRDFIRKHVVWFIQNDLGHSRSFDLEMSQDGSKFRKVQYMFNNAKEPVKDIIYYRLKELNDFFADRPLPETVKLEDHMTIKNVPLIISSHLSFLQENQHSKAYMPYYNRLLQLKEILQQNEIADR